MNQNPPNYSGNNGQGAPNGAGWNYGYQNVNQQPPYGQPNPYQQPNSYPQGAPQQTGYSQGAQPPYGQPNPYQPPNGYPQGAPQQQTAYPQGAQPPYGQPNPYQQPNGYPQGAPQQPVYGQPNPYQQPNAYPQGAQPMYGQGNPYQQPTGYPQGVPQQPYGQMGDAGGRYKTGGYQGGYGFDPMQQQQQHPGRLRFDFKMAARIVLFGVLPVLFVLAMVFSAIPALKWVFVALAVLSIIAIWVRPLVSESTRFTLSAVYGALAIVALVGALTGTAPGDSKAASANGGNSAAQVGSSQSGGAQQGGVQTDSPTPTPSPTPTERLSDSEAVRQLESFFYFWQNNQIEQMVELCAPSWKSGVQTPNNALFVILANRKVEGYETEKISGSDNDVSRTVTITATVNKSNGQTPMKYRFKVVMVKENDMWYVDPRSLDSQEAAEETPTPTPTFTPEPTAVVVVNNSTPLYYNPDGGSKYHSDANCASANARYLPFKGTFTYGEINNASYANLEPCNRCNAPVRQ